MPGNHRHTGVTAITVPTVAPETPDTELLLARNQSADHYDKTFFAWQQAGSRQSARRVLGLVQSMVQVESVVDVGCGTGGWLAVWQDMGITNLLGVDGEYIDAGQLLISEEMFEQRDLNQPWATTRRFDLVQSLEVAEHLLPESGPEFVRALCAMGDVVLFSAAQPGQGGENHINERPISYWQTLFERRGYRAFDPIRQAVLKDRVVAPWYRHNALIFANESGTQRLSDVAAASECTGSRLPTSYGDWGWELRRALLRSLPTWLVTAFSRSTYLPLATIDRLRRRLRESSATSPLEDQHLYEPIAPAPAARPGRQ